MNGRQDLLAPEGVYPGVDRILFGERLCLSISLVFCRLTQSFSPLKGTDHPFFPPLDGEGDRWKSVDENLDAIAGVPGWGDEERTKVMGTNAVGLFDLEL